MRARAWYTTHSGRCVYDCCSLLIRVRRLGSENPIIIPSVPFFWRALNINKMVRFASSVSSSLSTYPSQGCCIYSACYVGSLIASTHLIQPLSPSSSQTHGVGAGVPPGTMLARVGLRVGSLVGRLVGTFVGRVVGGPTTAWAWDGNCT